MDFVITYLKLYRFNDFRVHRPMKYHYWSMKLSTLYDGSIRKLFNDLVKSDNFVKIKINHSTYYVFDPYDKYKSYKPIMSLYINWK